MCNLLYIGPDYISVDHGSASMSSKMKANMETEVVRMIVAPIDMPRKIYGVERYHAPLRTAYTKLRAHLDCSSSDSDCLKIPVFSVNNTVRTEGLSLLLLVYGAIPRPSHSTPFLTQLQLARAI